MLGKNSFSLFQCYYICIWDYGYYIKIQLKNIKREKDNSESVHVYVNWSQTYWP